MERISRNIYWKTGKNGELEQCLDFTRKTGGKHWNFTFKRHSIPQISCTPCNNDYWQQSTEEEVSVISSINIEWKTGKESVFKVYKKIDIKHYFINM